MKGETKMKHARKAHPVERMPHDESGRSFYYAYCMQVAKDAEEMGKKLKAKIWRKKAEKALKKTQESMKKGVLSETI